MANYVHEIQFEIVPDGAAEFPEDAGGAYVNTYVVAESLESALQRGREVLGADGYRVVDASWVSRIDLEAYEPTEGEGCPTIDDLSKLIWSREYLYGPFHTYPIEEPDAAV